MELFEYNKFLKELSDYYERKEPKPGTTELWFSEVRKIPGEPLKWIAKKIENENDSFPRNLPSAVWGAYREWQQANPHKIAHKWREDCPDCQGGLIWARQAREGVRYTYVFACARCQQCTASQYPRALRAELMADYDVIPKGGDPAATAKKYRNLPDMLEGIGAAA